MPSEPSSAWLDVLMCSSQVDHGGDDNGDDNGDGDGDGDGGHLNHRASSQHLILSDSFMPQLNLPQLTRNQILFVNSFTSKLFRAMKKCDK